MKKHKHLGSKFDDFLEKEGLLEEVEAGAVKQAIAYKIQQEMVKQQLSKARMAALMRTSRSALDRLLDPENTAVTLNTLIKAASIVHKKITINLSDLKY